MTGGARRDALVIAEARRSLFRLVIPAAASPVERHAAEELQRFCREMSGAELPIVGDEEPPAPAEIVLGRSARLEFLGIAIDWTKLGDEGFQLITVGQTLVIAGGPVRGTLYGVYALLEEVFGCRWYTPSVSRIPKHDRLVVPKLNRTWVPALEYRESYWTEGWDGDWAARNRQNSSHARLEEKHGGKIIYEGFVHTMTRWVPTELFAEHPEYFAERKGVRQGGNAQRCLTHPEVLRLTIENVTKALREHPEARIISVS